MTTIGSSSSAASQLRTNTSASAPAAAPREDAFAQTELGRSLQAAEAEADRFERSHPGRILAGPVGLIVTGAVLCVPGVAAGAAVGALIPGVSAAVGAAVGGGLSVFQLLVQARSG
jgi:hypothetical protein